MPGEKLNNNNGGNEWAEAMSKLNQQEAPSETSDTKESKSSSDETVWDLISDNPAYEDDPDKKKLALDLAEKENEDIPEAIKFGQKWDWENITKEPGNLTPNKISEEIDQIRKAQEYLEEAKNAALSKKPFFLYPKEQREMIDKGQQLIEQEIRENPHTEYAKKVRESTLRKLGDDFTTPTRRMIIGDLVKLQKEGKDDLFDQIINNIITQKQEELFLHAQEEYGLRTASRALNGELAGGDVFQIQRRENDVDRAHAMALAEDPWRTGIKQIRDNRGRDYFSAGRVLQFDKAARDAATKAGLRYDRDKGTPIPGYTEEVKRLEQDRAPQKAQEAQETAGNMASASEAEAATQFSNEQSAEWLDKVNSDEQ